MKTLNKIARYFYSIGLAGIAIQQFIYADSRPVILPPLPGWLHASHTIAYIIGAILFTASVLIIPEKAFKAASLFTGGLFLFGFVAFQCPYMLYLQPAAAQHLGSWSDPFKQLAFAGGAFIIMHLPASNMHVKSSNNFLNMPEKLIVFARIFFSIMLIAFGLDHFYYTDFVTTFVPAWIPAHYFWTYFAGVALIGSGIAIILKIWIKPVALLLALMLFVWLIIVHIPRAVADPVSGNGNEITSVFEALAFSGIAIALAASQKNQSSPA